MEPRARGAVATSIAPTIPDDDVVRYAPDGLAVIDADARFVQANPVQ